MSSWSCTACTFLNPDQGDGKCMICRTSNPSPTPVTNMSCPICGKNNFSLSEIQSHVNACLSGGVPTPAVATVSPFSPPSNNMIDLTGVSNNINNSSDTSDSKMTTTATTTTTTTSPAQHISSERSHNRFRMAHHTQTNACRR
jgi:rubredoxin